jgi:hypothetical protein
MGTTCFLINTRQTTREVIEREHKQGFIAGERHGFDFEYLTMRGATGYGIMYRQDKDTAEKTFFGIVFKTGRHRTAYRGQVEFCIKEITEDMGPVQSDAPKKMLDMLDKLAPNPQGYAKEWRERCRTRLTYKAKARKPVAGERVQYNGVTYTLTSPFAPRLGWYVRDQFGASYRMSARILAECMRRPSQCFNEGE